MITTVGIIGGKGVMGGFFADFFRELDYTVIVSDKDTDLTNTQVAQQSDLLIFSVPIDLTVKIIEEVTPCIRENTILFDVTSIKTPALHAMMKTPAKEVVGGHPMFAPSTAIAGQVVVLTPGRGEKGLSFLQEVFTKAEARVRIMNAEKHDELMTVVQGLTHFTDIMLAKALSKTGIEIHEFLSVQSPAYRLKLLMMGRILAQDAKLYAHIQLDNPKMPETLALLQESVDELIHIVSSKNLPQFLDYFKTGEKYLGDFAPKALEESNHIIEAMFQKKSEFSPDDFTADLALLGPKNTYSALAADSFLNMESRKFCKTITEVFANVSSGKCQWGLVPVQNKLAGAVNETSDALWNFEDIVAVEEMEFAINNVLVSLKPVSMQEIETVYSHPQPLMQCSEFFAEHPHIEPVSVRSTMDAIFKLSARSAAIIPKQAAEKLKLPIISDAIANSSENFTRFVLIKKRLQDDVLQHGKRTMLAFELLNTKAGSLLKVLEYFAKEKINLLKLESKPVGSNGDTIFFTDAEGAMTQEQIASLKSLVGILKVFGIPSEMKSSS